MTMSTTPETATPDQRKAALAQAVQVAVIDGGRIESRTDYDAIIRYGKPVNHILHLLLTLVTLTLWVPVWAGIAIYAAVTQKAVNLTVDDYGNVLRQKL